VASREIVIGVEKRMKEYQTCWVDELSSILWARALKRTMSTKDNAKVEHGRNALQFIVKSQVIWHKSQVATTSWQGILMATTSSYHTRGNGYAEVANREIMIGVEKRMKEYKTCWVDELSSVLWAHRTTPK
ncbi:reverse transcriptase domain-containing protein, partial [Tanacetum coccineum]